MASGANLLLVSGSVILSLEPLNRNTIHGELKAAELHPQHHLPQLLQFSPQNADVF